MKSKVIFEYHDDKAIANAESLGMAEPEPEYRTDYFYFDITYIHASHLNYEGKIIIYLPSGTWILNYSEELWDKIKTHLQNENNHPI